MILYDLPAGMHPRRVRIFLAEKGVTIPTKVVDSSKGENQLPEFLQLNPMGRLPVLQLDDGRTFVGDMILGGYLGGTFMPTRAGEHYFHADRNRNLQNIRSLLKGSAREFYLGHGGPVSRESVAAAFGEAETRPTPAAR